MTALRKLDSPASLFRERVRVFFLHLPKALGGDPESVHDMRVAGRRLRVALPHLARDSESKRVTRALAVLKALTRAAGASRDLDVGLELFAAQPPEGSKPGGEIRRLRSRLQGAVRRGRVRMAESLMDVEIAQLRRDLRYILADGTEPDRQAALRRLRQTGDAERRAVIEGFDSLGDRYHADALHRLRIRARRLRYVIEIEGELAHAGAEAESFLKGLQESLGAVRDGYVLALWLRAQTETATRRGDLALAGEARRQAGRFLRASHEHHRTLLGQRPADGLRRLAPVGGRRAEVERGEGKEWISSSSATRSPLSPARRE